MLPEATQARKAVWDAINPHTGKRRIDEAFPAEIRATTREQDMMIKFINGSTWQVVGSDNFNSLVGSPPIGVVFSEWALADPTAWAYIRPILAENGGWALFITTPRGRNHAAKFYERAKNDPEWFCEKQTVAETNVFTPETLEKELRELIGEFGEDEGTAKFQQEYFCSFDAAVLGSYYGKLMNTADEAKRVTKVPYDPSCEVITAWDLGFGDSTSIWFAQLVGKEIHLIDYYENNGQGLDHYVKIVKEKGYNYSSHYLPHDAGSGQLGTGKSISQQLTGMGIKNHVLARDDVDSGIQQVRQLIPMCWFDAIKCAKGVEALRNYQKKWDDKNKTFLSKPMHDWSSHGSDAFRYLAMALPAVKTIIPKADFSIRQGRSWMA